MITYKPVRQAIAPMGSIILMLPDEEGAHYSKAEVDAEIASLKEKILGELLTELSNFKKDVDDGCVYGHQDGDFLLVNDVEKLIREKINER